MTLAQAVRHAEITAELRAGRERWVAALYPMTAQEATGDARGSESLEAHRRRDHADLHDRQVQRTLGRDPDQDLDAGIDA